MLHPIHMRMKITVMLAEPTEVSVISVAIVAVVNPARWPLTASPLPGLMAQAIGSPLALESYGSPFFSQRAL